MGEWVSGWVRGVIFVGVRVGVVAESDCECKLGAVRARDRGGAQIAMDIDLSRAGIRKWES